MTRETPGPARQAAILSVRTELWFAWVEIAGEQELTAAAWRRKAADDVAAGRNPSTNMAQETKASMASASAAAAALETFGNYLHYFTNDRPKDGPAAGRVLAQVRRVYPDAPITPELARRVQGLFTRRNKTLHYASKPQQMGEHPLGMNSTWVARTFTVEAARDAVDVLAELLTAAFNPGNSHIKPAEWDASRCRYIGKALRMRTSIPLDVVP